MRNGSFPATVVAAHIQHLTDATGATNMDIARAAQVSERTIRFIINADPDRGVYSRTAQRIMSIRTLPTGHRLVPAHRTQRHVEALSAIGWSRKEVARRARLSDSALHPSSLEKYVYATTEAAVNHVYETLKFRPRTDARGDQVRALARRLGYAPPWAWTVRSLADPTGRPNVSEVENDDWAAQIRKRYSLRPNL